MSCHLTCACQVIARTLHGLRYNDEPAEHTGTATLCRLSTPGTCYGHALSVLVWLGSLLWLWPRLPWPVRQVSRHLLWPTLWKASPDPDPNPDPDPDPDPNPHPDPDPNPHPNPHPPGFRLAGMEHVEEPPTPQVAPGSL